MSILSKRGVFIINLTRSGVTSKATLWICLWEFLDRVNWSGRTPKYEWRQDASLGAGLNKMEKGRWAPPFMARLLSVFRLWAATSSSCFHAFPTKMDYNPWAEITLSPLSYLCLLFFAQMRKVKYSRHAHGCPQVRGRRQETDGVKGLRTSPSSSVLSTDVCTSFPGFVRFLWGLERWLSKELSRRTRLLPPQLPNLLMWMFRGASAVSQSLACLLAPDSNKTSDHI